MTDMQATMGRYPLRVHHFFDRMRRLHHDKHVVTKTEDGQKEATYGEVVDRTLRLITALRELGVSQGDRVASFQWNNQVHLEGYMALPLMGGVLHTVNIRLFPDQITYMVNQAEDKVIIADASVLKNLDKVAGEIPSVKHLIVNNDGAPVETSLDVKIHDYEELISSHEPAEDLAEVEETDAAASCYTSGTTGNPKGVVYSHRSLFLHTMGICLPDAIGIQEADVVMPVVPMFHVLAWGTPYAAVMTGADLVFPHRFMDPESVASLLSDNRVTVTAAVPTVWNELSNFLSDEETRNKYDLSHLRAVVIGGSAVPKAIIEFFRDTYDVPVLHAWGMTEMSPIGSIARIPKNMDDASEEERMKLRLTQGRPVPGVELRIVDHEGDREELPWDGEAKGEIEARGAWVTDSYFGIEAQEKFHDGWLKTGDVAIVHPNGFFEIVDRVKDLIKSGGEWISSVELENSLMGHEAVAEAAVIAMPDEKWDERPMAVVVLKEGEEATKEDLNEYLKGQVADWWLPDRYEFVDDIPKTATGKFSKKDLRERFFGEEEA